MTTKVIVKLHDIKVKSKIDPRTTHLAIWKNVRGLWKNHKVDPVHYQRQSRKERTLP